MNNIDRGRSVPAAAELPRNATVIGELDADTKALAARIAISLLWRRCDIGELPGYKK